jgi:polyphenol oxidase
MPFALDEIKWGMSEKKDGSMKLYFDDVLDEAALGNRKKFFSALGVDLNNVVSADLAHGNNVAIAEKTDGGRLIPNTDALVTKEPGMFLTVTGADCVPIYFYDPKFRVVGLAHAGWRGVVKNIAAAAIAKMKENYGSELADIRVFVGPHIRSHHFEVKEDVAKEFASYPDRIVKPEGKILIDLGGVIKDQLVSADVNENNIEIDQTCTFCENEKYFSFRRDKPTKLQTMVAYIGIKFS